MALLLSLASLGTGVSAAGSEVADAVMRGDAAAARTLLAQKADVNAKQADGATALHWAVYRADTALTDLLLQAGANPSAANSEGATPLSLACLNGSAAIVDSLLKAGADANERMPRGETALMMASRTGNTAVVKLLLDRGANVNAKESLRGTTALMWAADQGHAATVKLLVERGADVAMKSNPAPRGRTAYLGKANDPRRSNRALQAAAAGATRAEVERLSSKDERDADQRVGGAQPVAGQGQPPAAAQPQPRQQAPRREEEDRSGGGLTALAYAARANSQEAVTALLDAGADINQTTGYGWSPLLVATQNRFYQLGSFLLDKGADPNTANTGGWTPLYLAVDNRNIEGGDYPVRKGDMDHLDFIKKLLDKGADVNARMKDSTETRTVFTNQWLDEDGATAFLRASQSSDLEVMHLLLAHGADPKIPTVGDVTALQVAAGIGWVDGLTYEWSPKANEEAVKLLLDLGVDPNIQAETGRTALHGAGHKGRTAVIQMLVDHGAKLDTRDYGMTGNDAGGRLAVHTWQPVDYADGLVRVGVQSAVAHPEAGLLLRKLMTESGLEAPPMGRTLASVCITEICDVETDDQGNQQ
ncbi:MAG TPA: ankyrin repeat domain-containing protein [Vicinamibacterales bacterium]|nr:ankyrin repeat domain-containing protein [Vicinamibacterales bacterium]